MASTPPDWQLRPPRRRPRTLWSDLGRLWAGFRGLPVIPQLIIGTIAVILLVALISIPCQADEPTTVASRSSTTLRRALPTTSTTRPPLIPPGDDKTVKTVIDGDSFETSDGVKVRLIGIDAPDTEIRACFSAEAKSQLTSLLPSPSTVRLVYDESRTDRFGRTLAHVYRLPDGLLLSVALARDGFAIQQTTAPNAMHSDEIAAAVADARSARRGLWQSCQTTTTVGGPAPTRAPATTEVPETTTVTEPESTTTTVIAPGPTTTSTPTASTTAPP